MFTSSMNNLEIRNEALQDFLELKTKFQILLEEYIGMQKRKRKENMLHSIIHTKTFRTRRHNTWEIRLFEQYEESMQLQVFTQCIHSSFQRGDQTYYLFLNDCYEFNLMLVTSHFMQRYKERYLIPGKIDLRGMHPAIYFFRSSLNMNPTNFIPETWSEEERKKRIVWLSEQGLIVTESQANMLILITFLDQKDLTRYKSLIYEEEHLNKLIMNSFELRSHGMNNAANDLTMQWAKIPDCRRIYFRFIERVTDKNRPDYDSYMKAQTKLWNLIEKIIARIQNKEEGPIDYSDLTYSDILVHFSKMQKPKIDNKHLTIYRKDEK